MSPAFMAVSLDGRATEAASIIGAVLPDTWPDADTRRRLTMRLEQMQARPADADWLLRAMVERDSRRVVGFINFHGPTDEAGRAELGYTVLEASRRRGYATEAVLGMMAWAHREHGVRRFLLSISPQNTPSLGLAGKLGFVRTGEQMDEEDGLEWMFELSLAPPSGPASSSSPL